MAVQLIRHRTTTELPAGHPVQPTIQSGANWVRLLRNLSRRILKTSKDGEAIKKVVAVPSTVQSITSLSCACQL